MDNVITPQPQEEKKGIQGILLALVLVIIFGIIISYVASPSAKTKDIGNGQTLTEATQGTVLSAFPKELILDQAATIEQSYVIDYPNKDKQLATTLHSKKTIAEVIALYRDYLGANGWQVTHQARADETPSTFFYGYKGNTQVNINLQSLEDGTRLILGYTIKGQ